ncbi:MAG: WbqC family protein [Kiritimatiellae bacterium]|jgi:hypothetical protein|nr:WbqC family protein [Kiritimatiellia bacterium]
MKIAIMQPYLFPYIGYFQLLNAVDLFVIYDDVQYIKGGWINRNRLLVNGSPKFFTLPIKKDSHSSLINQRVILCERWAKDRRKVFTMIQQNYGKAPYYEKVFSLVEECLCFGDLNLVSFIYNVLEHCCTYLNIETNIVRSSSLSIENDLRAEDRVIAICEKLNAEHYINPIGGVGLYMKNDFAIKNIKLSFVETDEIYYRQFSESFIPFLSIIDVMMFNSVEKIQSLLTKYELL